MPPRAHADADTAGPIRSITHVGERREKRIAPRAAFLFSRARVRSATLSSSSHVKSPPLAVRKDLCARIHLSA